MSGAYSVKRVVETLVYTAATFLATVLLVVETPATGGYFNLGEAAIYSIAVIASSPLVAGVAAGLGPAIADIVLGYSYFAPATLVIKFLEGFLVASLARRMREKPSPALRLAGAGLAVALAFIVGVALGTASGEIAASLSWTNASIAGVSFAIPTATLYLPGYTWAVVALLAAALGLAVLVAPKTHYALPAMAMGGLLMVTGYFLYEYFVSNPLILHRDPIGAVFEVPVNMGQALAGIVLSYPVVRFVEKARGAESRVSTSSNQ